ncbi:MAG: D-alanyl-D-alanine carboxypeptidase/D-alanyl-D-alanine-endopeptidase [Oscillatoria sp. PMC 1051.18]|nr:D-alanyl-D-alanine carboxypeptidase/D-alanyl-D-alanine-endopeptidase [Oscillatoria sp. PMC 1050.18]MEC5031372.1 D-alanyl-D-alanine carboxypeptidase/D-alanyl-D-alanine-endopeptidase [Oscillatoria sp. PMC 1051.18]
MKSSSHWLKPLTVFAVAALTWAETSVKIAHANPSTTLAQNVESVEIYVPPPETGNTGVCPYFLEGEIKEIIDSSSFAGARWGILVESLESGETFYSYNANSQLIPASNTKLFTAAAALQRLDNNAVIRSKSLKEWIGVTLLMSNNSYADVLLRYLGGAGAVKTALANLGVNPGGYRQVDGSGLSRQNAATPDAIVDTLKAMKNAKGRDIFYSSLPVAGVSGTLRNRFRNTSVQGKVRAKTGTLTGVRALSGYLEHPQYGTIVFSIVANHPGSSGRSLISGIDRIVLDLNRLTPCDI